MTDTFPATLTGLAVTSCPSGATCTIAGQVLTVSNASVAANGTAAVTVSATIAGAGVGTTIDNCATVTNPAGVGASPCASTIVVSQSSIPVTGNKPLYLYDNTSTPAYKLSRTAPTSGTFVTITNGTPQTWAMSPMAQTAITISQTVSANVPVNLYMRRGTTSGNRGVTVSLRCSSGGTTLTQTQTLAFTNTITLYTFNLPISAPLTCGAGYTWNLTVTNNSAADTVRVYSYNAGADPAAILPATTVISVQSVTAYIAIYPSVTTPPSGYFSGGNTVYVARS